MNSFPDFPLYSSLKNRLKENRKPLPSETEDFISRVKNMSDREHETIYTLIRCYYIETTQDYTLEYPYNMKVNKKNIINIKLDNLPQELQNILLLFVKILE